MSQKFFIIGCFLFTSIALFSQNINFTEKKSEIPLSIYLENNTPHFLNTSFVDDLKLTNFKFLLFNNESLMTNSFTIELRNFGRRGTQFSYESYKDFDLYKYFPAVPDIIQLHRFNNNIKIGVN